MTRSMKMQRTSHDFKIYCIMWGVCICTFHVCLHMRVHEYACEVKRSTPTTFLNFLSPLYVLRQGLSLMLELTNSAKLASQQASDSPSICLPNTEVPSMHCHARLFTWELKLRASCLHGKHCTD